MSKKYHIFIETLIKVMGLKNTIKYLTYAVKVKRSTFYSDMVYSIFSTLVDWEEDTSEGHRYWEKFYRVLQKDYNNINLDLHTKLTYGILEEFLNDMKSKKPEPIKQTKKESTMIAVFNKGVPNIKGIFYQLALTSATETRPFVLELIEKEQKRIKDLISKMSIPSSKPINGNIKLAHFVEIMQRLKKEINFDPSLVEITIKNVVNYYEYQKALKANKKSDFSWFNKELTQNIMSKKGYTNLFDSNKLCIGVEDGYALLTETIHVPGKPKKEIHYKAPIKYSEVTNTFYV